MEKKEISIKEAILSGKMCEDCCYYEFCYYDRDCIAMEFLKKTAIIHEILYCNDTNKSGDKA